MSDRANLDHLSAEQFRAVLADAVETMDAWTVWRIRDAIGLAEMGRDDSSDSRRMAGDLRIGQLIREEAIRVAPEPGAAPAGTEECPT